MSVEIDCDFLRAQALAQGVELNQDVLLGFSLYARMLVDYNQKCNLTAITQPRDIINKHFIDSLTLLPLIPKGKISLIDVGTGAGFPGVPLALVRKDIELTLLDSLNKRLEFLKELCQELNIKAKIIHARAEQASKQQMFRQQYDIATARAVAPLSMLSELCLPFVKVGGAFIAMKGSKEDNFKGANILGAELAGTKQIRIEDGFQSIDRQLLIFKKISDTPPQYPRAFAKIKNNPL